MKKKIAAMVVAGLLVAGCNCSPTEPKYRCSDYGIVEVQAAWQFEWKPVSGSAIVRCEPGKPITPEMLR